MCYTGYEMDVRKTTVIKTAIVRKSGIAEILRQIWRSAQDTVYSDIRLPDDQHDRLVAINAMHNVFDRIDEAIEKHIKESTDSIPVIVEGDQDE